MNFKMPVLFISHGAPDILLQDDPAITAWQHQAEILPRPKSILIISAHWETNHFKLGGNRLQETIHDFGGFPSQLYQLKYPAKENVKFADELSRQLDIDVSHDRGLDHGSWVPLLAMYPQADIPVTQLSVAPHMGCEAHYHLGEKLEELRSQGVLIIASGVIVHNLAKLKRHGDQNKPDSWAQEFMSVFEDSVSASKWQNLVQPYNLPSGSKAVPTLEHYLPFLVAAGAAGEDKATCFYDGWRYGNLSMHCYRFG